VECGGLWWAEVVTGGGDSGVGGSGAQSVRQKVEQTVGWWGWTGSPHDRAGNGAG